MLLPPEEALLTFQERGPQQEDQQAPRGQKIQRLVNELLGQTIGRVSYNNVVERLRFVVEEVVEDDLVGDVLQLFPFFRPDLDGVDPVGVASTSERSDNIAVSG